MAGTLTNTDARIAGLAHELTIDLTSTAGGAVTEDTTVKVGGFILQVGIRPDSGGTQPTDQFDLVINDAYGRDILRAGGGNLSNASDTWLTPVIDDGLVFVNSLLSIALSNAGDSKGVTVVIYWAEL